MLKPSHVSFYDEKMARELIINENFQFNHCRGLVKHGLFYSKVIPPYLLLFTNSIIQRWNIPLYDQAINENKIFLYVGI